MNIKKILKIVVCLVLVCALMVQISPIKSEAFAMEMALTGVAAAGAVGLLYLAMAGGAVYVPEGIGTLEAVGTAFTEYMYQWGSTAEKLEECEEFFGGLTLYGGNPDDDDPDDKPERITKILDGIRRGAALFTAAAILGECTFLMRDPNFPLGGRDVATFTQYFSSSQFYETTIKVSAGYTGTFIPILIHGGWEEYDQNGYIVFAACDTKIYLSRDGTTVSPKFSSDLGGYYCRVSGGNGSTDFYYSADFPIVDIGIYSNSSEFENAAFNYFVNYCKTQGASELQPNSFVTAVKDQLSSGELSANDLIIPDINYANLIGPDGSLVTGITDTLKRLDEGIITHEEFMEIVTVPVPVPDPVPDPSEDPTVPSSPEIIAPDDPDVDVDVGDETLANTNAQTFLEQLSDVVATPFKWIWGKIETFFSKALKPEIWLDPLPEIVLQPVKWIWEKIETTFAPLLDPEVRRAPFDWIWGKIEPIPGIITDAVSDAATDVKEAVQSLVVPDKDYLSDKVAALCAEFAFADAIVRTAQALHLGLANIATEPPVIYIDLGAFRGDYNIGGRVPFLDLRWYAEYKPTVDIIISAFLWICFAWRIFMKLPGIISGMPGDFVAGSADAFGLRDMLPARNADYAQERAEIRKSLWKGRNK